MLDRCEGPTLDVGCGAGRLTVALIQRGVEAVGLDISKEAVRIARARGAMARQGDVFDERPTQPQWQHLLLADGNIGIGGCPASLLKHARSLVGESGSVLVDVESFGRGVRAGHVEVMAHGYAGWMRWARVGLDAIEGLACTAGLVVTSVVDDGLDRHVVELRWA
jgi:SAM-dependent methyltransferase